MPSVPATAPTAQLSTSIFIPPQIQGSWAEHMQSEAATNTTVNTKASEAPTLRSQPLPKGHAQSTPGVKSLPTVSGTPSLEGSSKVIQHNSARPQAPQLPTDPRPCPAAPVQESGRQPTSALPQGRSMRTDQRVEQTNPQEQLEREQDQIRYRILLDAIRGQFQGTGSPNTPLQPNVSVGVALSSSQTPSLAPQQQSRDTGTVEELTAATEATHSFHNLAVLLRRGSPLRYSYTVLMGWIHEMTYQVTSINVQRDQLTELVLPRLLTPSSQQDYFRNTLQLFNITEDLFRESLQYASAVTAHATRMIRVLEAYQMLQVLHHRVTPHDEEDAEYTHLMQANMPETLDPSSYIETLRWWRENYSDALMIHNTRGYLRTHEVDRMLQEQQGQQSTMTAHTTQPPQSIRQTTTQAPAHTGPSTSVSGSSAPFGSAESATSAQLPVVIPQFVRPQQTPTTRTDGRSEARQEHHGQRRTRPMSPDQRSQEDCPAKKSHEDT
ncbi:unnamed protein product [Heligmosomoides polygyrus]|uniref:SP-RING-type domain-containing protein n=1 Tax=Heligmosomoides polygyrus TaxID=6339 RepID=A0A183FPF6_HELPZ|nr:unnamed protein product [Heligmosomoides polygyrus]